jgi:hypothetical protein
MRFIAQIQIDYTDGTSDTIVTDGTWKVRHRRHHLLIVVRR